jgi:hypothetical protein
LFGQKFLKIRAIALSPASIAAACPKRIQTGGSGERNLLTRSIDFDPYGLTMEEKIFRGAKRGCVVFALAALSLGVLDLMNIKSESAAQIFQAGRLRFADLPDRIRTEIGRISLVSSPPSATIAIPRAEIAQAARPSPAATASLRLKTNPSPVAELSAATDLDAIEFAMAPPSTLAKPEPLVAAAPDTKMILASADPGDMPSAMMTPPTLVSLPMSIAVLPPPAPGLPPPSPAERLHLEGPSLAKAERCLANAVYFEARSEPLNGQIAVAQVVMNRVFSGFYPNDVCGVVYQNASRHLACQFTFACDGKRKVINERGAWARANRIAKQTLAGSIYETAVGTSTHYHAIYVHPNWVREMHKFVRFGIHNFYRPIAWGNGSDEPVWSRAQLAVNKKK